MYLKCSIAVVRVSDSQLRAFWLNHVLMCQTVNCFFVHCSGSFSSMKAYLAKDNGGYLCTNSLHALIAPWLDACQRSVYLNRGVKYKVL